MFTSLLTFTSSSERNIIPIQDTVAGEAYLKLSVSNMKFTLSPNEIRSPLGSVNRWLSSSTEFKDSTHSGSISPSQMIQHLVSKGSFTIDHAEAVKTPSLNSLVSWSISPNNNCLGIDFGFITCVTILIPSISYDCLMTFHIVVFPHPDGPTITTPIHCLDAS